MKLFLFFLILAVGTSLLTFIPEWRNLEMVLVLAMLLASALAGSLHLSRYWKHHRNSLKTGLRTVGIIFLWILLSLFSLIFLDNLVLFNPHFVSHYKWDDADVYQYEYVCFIPDNACECDDYYTLIYQKLPVLPVMHVLKNLDFYVGDIKRAGSTLKAEAAHMCPQDEGKEASIELN